MATSTIEQLDQFRYNNIKWFTISWAIWYGAFIIKNVLTNKIFVLVIIAIGLTSWIFWVINLYRFITLGIVVNNDPVLKSALNDELMQHNRLRAFTIGYWVTTIVIGVLLIFALFTNISAQLVCEIALYIAVLSGLISSLIYNRG